MSYLGPISNYAGNHAGKIAAKLMKREHLLDLNEILQFPGKKLSIDVTTDFAKDPEIELMEPMEGFLEAVSTGNILLLKGEFKAKVIADCARCGGKIEVPVEFEVDEQF